MKVKYNRKQKEYSDVATFLCLEWAITMAAPERYYEVKKSYEFIDFSYILHNYLKSVKHWK